VTLTPRDGGSPPATHALTEPDADHFTLDGAVWHRAPAHAWRLAADGGFHFVTALPR
jgi:hypothetical protein